LLFFFQTDQAERRDPGRFFFTLQPMGFPFLMVAKQVMHASQRIISSGFPARIFPAASKTEASRGFFNIDLHKDFPPSAFIQAHIRAMDNIYPLELRIRFVNQAFVNGRENFADLSHCRNAHSFGAFIGNELTAGCHNEPVAHAVFGMTPV
jgi:hypothetical protein